MPDPHQSNKQTNRPAHLPPLVINADQPVVGAKRRQARGVREQINHVGKSVAAFPVKTNRRRWVSGSLIVIIALSMTALWWTSRVTKPDPIEDPLDRVLGFALLEANFNKLPVDERIDMIAALVKRLSAMDGQNAGMLGGFAAGINGREAREQLAENMTKLLADILEEVSRDYANPRPEEREKLAEKSFVDMVRKFSRFDGNPDTRTDEEILADGKRQAQRDRSRANPWQNQTGMASRMFSMSREEIGERQSPQAQQRFWMMMGDVTKMLSGEEVAPTRNTPNPDPQPAPSTD
jgi:hypothetical protein